MNAVNKYENRDSKSAHCDNATLINQLKLIDKASERINIEHCKGKGIMKGSRELADMEVRIDKTETMFVWGDVCGWPEWEVTNDVCGWK